MALRTLNHLMALSGLRSEIVDTLSKVKAHPLTEAHAPVYEALREEWTTILQEELAHRDALSAVQALIYVIDMTLNSLANRVSKTLLTLTGEDRTHSLYIAYFGQQSLSEFRRPILGKQHAQMKAWIPALTASDHSELSALGAEVEVAVAAADKALAKKVVLEKAGRIFREAGNRKKFFDKVNCIRKETYGAITQLPHSHPHLPANFADLFFRHDTTKKDEEELETQDSLEAMIAQTEQDLAEQKARLDRFKAEMEQRAKQAEEKAAQEASVAALELAAAEANEKARKARADLDAMAR